MNNVNQIEMPKYKCHKVVHALKIKSINPADSGSGFIIIPEEDRYDPFYVSLDYAERHRPKDGGYYVVYEDGYKSFSPAEAFEGGYTKL